MDTDVLSDSIKTRPSHKLAAWVEANEANLYTSAISIGELKRGIVRLAPGIRRTQLEKWLEGVLVRMSGRILSFNTRVGESWGEFMADLEKRGQKMPLADSLIAAIAKRHNLIIATGNTADFVRAGIRVVNPFK